jgi:hypothetical protein
VAHGAFDVTDQTLVGQPPAARDAGAASSGAAPGAASSGAAPGASRQCRLGQIESKPSSAKRRAISFDARSKPGM